MTGKFQAETSGEESPSSDQTAPHSFQVFDQVPASLPQPLLTLGHNMLEYNLYVLEDWSSKSLEGPELPRSHLALTI